jgi:hypothetical protein
MCIIGKLVNIDKESGKWLDNNNDFQFKCFNKMHYRHYVWAMF